MIFAMTLSKPKLLFRQKIVRFNKINNMVMHSFSIHFWKKNKSDRFCSWRHLVYHKIRKITRKYIENIFASLDHPEICLSEWICLLYFIS